MGNAHPVAAIITTAEVAASAAAAGLEYFNTVRHIDGLVQERRNSSALAMELRLSCTKP